MKNKKVVVTGGLGFIGSNLVEKLVQNNEVTIIDDLSTGKMANVSHLDQNKLKIVKGSIVNLDLLKIFKDHDFVFHQAALPGVPRRIKDPKATNDAGITGTLNVLVAAKDAGIKKVVYASSSSVYGDTPTLPKKEDMPINPLSPYAVSKAAGELYCSVFHNIYGLKTTSLRYFNVFGPRQDLNSQYAAVIPKFIKAIQHDESPIIYGYGEQSRDFTYIDHVVDANILACESKCTGIYNIACGRRITINQLVDLINEICHKNVKPKYVDPLTGDIKHSLADISRSSAFGYKLQGNFKDELEKTIKGYKFV
jgi:UDP-glucose 4-epimerase